MEDIRNRIPIDWSSTGVKNYRDFKKKNKNIDISNKDWRLVNLMFYDMARDYILSTGKPFKFAAGIGSVYIHKKIRRKFNRGKINLPIDWKRSKELGKKVYLLNAHTEGYFFGYLWHKEKSMLYHSRLFIFEPSRISSRSIKKYIDRDPSLQKKYNEWNINLM